MRRLGVDDSRLPQLIHQAIETRKALPSAKVILMYLGCVSEEKELKDTCFGEGFEYFGRLTAKDSTRRLVSDRERFRVGCETGRV